MTAERTIIRWTVLILIGVLTLASIGNIYQMTNTLHHSASGWNMTSGLISVGFGLAFALLTYVVMICESAATKWTVGLFAIIAAAVSSTIQTAFYLSHDAGFWVATAYGVGVPAFEAFLAITEALLGMESENKTQTVTQSRWTRLSDLAFDRLADRLADRSPVVQADRSDAGQLTVQAEQPAAANAGGQVVEFEAEPEVDGTKLDEANLKRTVSKEQAMVKLIDYYRDHPDASQQQAADHIGKSKSAVNSYLKELREAGTVNVNGKVEVLV